MALPAPLMTQAPRDRRAVLADPALRRSLTEMVRRRLPESDVEDVVQATLIEALASQSAPTADEGDALKRWVFGIARHKVADFHRKSRRESPTSEPPEGATDGEPHSARDMLRWAEEELPPGDGSKETLNWLLREGEGEKLEAIAASEKLPAPRVRQRVVRLRKHFRERWAAELAAIVAATIAIGVWIWLSKKKPVETPIARDVPSSVVNPQELSPEETRKLALDLCARHYWKACVDDLDRAAQLDPAGDQAPEVVAARKAAADALTPPPVAPSATYDAPSKSLPPVPTSLSTPTPTVVPIPTLVPTSSGSMNAPVAPTSMTPSVAKKPAPPKPSATDSIDFGTTFGTPSGPGTGGAVKSDDPIPQGKSKGSAKKMSK
jgi:DNA-directed RNA polymerase specialized sigma24 family protein